jgi:hypothetical protein
VGLKAPLLFERSEFNGAARASRFSGKMVKALIFWFVFYQEKMNERQNFCRNKKAVHQERL